MVSSSLFQRLFLLLNTVLKLYQVYSNWDITFALICCWRKHSDQQIFWCLFLSPLGFANHWTMAEKQVLSVSAQYDDLCYGFNYFVHSADNGNMKKFKPTVCNSNLIILVFRISQVCCEPGTEPQEMAWCWRGAETYAESVERSQQNEF